MMDFKQWVPSTDSVPRFDLVTGKDGMPAFRLEANKQDITNNIRSRLMSLTLTDNRGSESDQLDIELDDADGNLIFPLRGDILTLELGWHGHPLTPKGKFVVDEIEHSGAPDRLTIRARSADFRGDLNAKREVSYHKITLESLVSTIAMRNQLTFKISNELKGISMHIDQTNESDISLLTRIAKQEGAIASVKNGELLFICQGKNKTSSGTTIDPVVITRESGDSHRFSLSDREAYTGVKAQWLDTKTASKQTVTYKRDVTKKNTVEVSVHYENSKTQSATKNNQTSFTPDLSNYKNEQKLKKGKDNKPGFTDLSKKNPKSKEGKKSPYNKSRHKEENRHNKNTGKTGNRSYEEQRKSVKEPHQTTTDKQEAKGYLQGSPENILTLSRIYQNKEDAERAAKAVWDKIQRGVAEFSITLARGRADIYPEKPVHIKGFKPQINDTDWTIVKVTHNLNDSGFTTSLDLEVKLDEVEIKSEAKDPKINS